MVSILKELGGVLEITLVSTEPVLSTALTLKELVLDKYGFGPKEPGICVGHGFNTKRGCFECDYDSERNRFR